MTQELNKAIRRSVLEIGAEASKRSPVDTGRMRASILGEGTRFRSLYGEVGPTPFYSIYVHEGTRYMHGRPFLRDAVQVKESMVQSLFVDAVQKVLDDIGKET